MSQHDMDIANGSGATFRADLNSALLALASCSSGATAPSPTFAYQYWADTANDLLKQRNAANTAWISIMKLSTGRALLASEASAAPGNTPFSFRNKLINANFAINQRAYVSGTATSGANTYTLDRWRVVTSGQNLAFSASGNGNSITAPAGGIEQVIEGANIEGGIYTLSWVGAGTAAVNGSAITNGGQTASLTAGANVTIKFIGAVSKVQFEIGAIATPFEHRPGGLELGLCQRYYCQTSGQYSGQCITTTSALISVNFPVTMRSAPTLEANITAGALLSAGGSSASAISISAPAATICGAYYTATVSSGLVAGNATMHVSGVNQWSAEL